MAGHVRINGVDIDNRLLIQNIVFIVAVVFVAWPITIMNIHRVYLRYKIQKTKFRNLRVYWGHILACTLLASGIGVDLNHIFFDRSYWLREFCIGEYVIVGANVAIFYFFSHIETFFTAELGRLSVPRWLPMIKVRWMVGNAVLSNICLLIRIGTMRVFLSGLMHQFVAFQFLVLGPVLIFISWKVARQLQDLYEDCPASAGNILRNIRRFRIFAFLSSLVMIAIGSVFTEHYWDRWSTDPHLTIKERGWLDREREPGRSLSFNYVRWMTIPALLYLFWLFWVSKEPNVSGAPSPSPSKTPLSADNANLFARHKRLSEETGKLGRLENGRDRGISQSSDHECQTVSMNLHHRGSQNPAVIGSNESSDSILSRVFYVGSRKRDRVFALRRGDTKKLDSIVSHVYDNHQNDKEATIGNVGAMCLSPPSVARFASHDNSAGSNEQEPSSSISSAKTEDRRTSPHGTTDLESGFASDFSEDEQAISIVSSGSLSEYINSHDSQSRGQEGECVDACTEHAV